MAVLVTSDRPLRSLRWDGKRKQYVGWRIDVYVSQGRGKKPKRHRVIYPSEAEAKLAENRLRVKSDNIKLGIESPDSDARRIAVRALFEKRLAEIRNHAERVRAERVFQAFLDVNPDLEFVDETRPVHVGALIEKRTTDGVTAATVTRELSPLLTAFRRAPRLFRELENFQLGRIERPKVKTTPRQTTVSESEMLKICASLRSLRSWRERSSVTADREPLALMFELAWFLGLRHGECRKLLKSDYRRDQKTLRVMRWKTGTVSLLEFLPDRVIEILDAAAALSSSDLIFDIKTSVHSINVMLRRACEANGLPHGIKTTGGITFHSTRHSFASRLIQVTDLATARTFTGHSNSEMVAYYSHASAESKRAAMAALYGQTQNADALRELYDDTRFGRLEFEEFEKRIKLLK